MEEKDSLSIERNLLIPCLSNEWEFLNNSMATGTDLH